MKKDVKEHVANNVARSLNNDLKGEEYSVIVVGKKKVKLPANVMVFQKFATAAAMSEELSPSSLRVFMYIIGQLAYENVYIGIDQDVICSDLSMSPRTVKYALAQLKEYNILISIRSGSDKRRNDYCVNPQACWKGNGEARVKKMKTMIPEDHQLRLPMPETK
jgi:hypothetical protein